MCYTQVIIVKYPHDTEALTLLYVLASCPGFCRGCKRKTHSASDITAHLLADLRAACGVRFIVFVHVSFCYT
jgi:L-lysine 2,3-aminomutase